MNCRRLIIGMAWWMAGCAAGPVMVARDRFIATHQSCAPQLVRVRLLGDVPPNNGSGRAVPADVTGCGSESTYLCAPTSGSFRCSDRHRVSVVATDGSMYQAWGDDIDAAARDAALASATHDLQCARAAVVVVVPMRSLEGCGSRVSYEIVDNHFRLIGRVPIASSAR
jgi:hypothetical protein